MQKLLFLTVSNWIPSKLADQGIGLEKAFVDVDKRRFKASNSSKFKRAIALLLKEQNFPKFIRK